MSDSVQIPPEVLDVFRKIRAVVNASVDYLEALQPSAVQLSADGTATVAGSLSATLSPLTVRATAHIPTPTVTVTNDATSTVPPVPTVEEVKMARAWLAAGATGLLAVRFISDLEGLLQFAERILEALGLK